MKKLNVEKMKNIKGEGWSAAGICAVVGGIIAFFVGAIDGYTRPFRCR